MSPVLRGREAAVFTCFTDVVVAPAGDLPAVVDTDALEALEAQLRAAPAVNRLAIRGMLLAVETGPRLLGHRAGLRALAREDRVAAVAGMQRHAALAPVVKALQGLAHLSYYGDDRVMRHLGYDADAVVARATALRAAEGRW